MNLKDLGFLPSSDRLVKYMDYLMSSVDINT